MAKEKPQKVIEEVKVQSPPINASDTREASDSDSSSSDSVDVDDIFNYKAKDFDYTHKTLTEI